MDGARPPPVTSAWVLRFKALSDETRVRICAALSGEELSVGEIADVLETPQPGVSRHLAALSTAGLVSSRKQGTATFYRLTQTDPVLDGPFRAELHAVARDEKLAARVERVLLRRAQRSQSFFDQAEDWDTLRAELFADAAGYASLLPLVPRGLVVADIGTGTGGMLPFLAEVATRIHAIDRSTAMLRRAKAKAERLGLSGVTFERGDLEALPLRSHSVDAAFLSLVLHHAAQPAVALAEAARVVRPGGTVVVVDLGAHGHEWLREEQEDVWLGFAETEIKELARKAGLLRVRHRVVSRTAARQRKGAPLELFVLSGQLADEDRKRTSSNPPKKTDPPRTTAS